MPAELSDAAEEFLAKILTTPRTRTPDEAPLRLTHAYVKLLFACGFRRLKALERSQELVTEARLVLEGEQRANQPDAIHTYLLADFAHRLASPLGTTVSEPMALAS